MNCLSSCHILMVPRNARPPGHQNQVIRCLLAATQETPDTKPGLQIQNPGHQTYIKIPLQEILGLSSAAERQYEETPTL